MRESETHALPSRRQVLRVGAAAAAAAGVPTIAAPGAHASEAAARGRDGVPDGTTFMACKGVTGDEQIWWSRLVGNTWSAPQHVVGALSSFRPALATIGS
ncbi:twin-arginine translocation signal domain-containing protein [Streptomyces sp. NPDC053474]|uniref:twin-arginine translocation signal domain-containing protein n=1 Tax=Streptomyces sp. NPDC053474 TaxID=3365704 RepID=UPI0037D24F71